MEDDTCSCDKAPVKIHLFSHTFKILYRNVLSHAGLKPSYTLYLVLSVVEILIIIIYFVLKQSELDPKPRDATLERVMKVEQFICVFFYIQKRNPNPQLDK